MAELGSERFLPVAPAWGYEALNRGLRDLRWRAKSANQAMMGLAFSTPAAGLSWGATWQASVMPVPGGCTVRISGATRISSMYNITANYAEGKQLAHLFDRIGAHAAAMLEADPTGGMEPAQAAPTAASGGGMADQLAKLAQLHADGLLDADEFASAKAKLLGA
jgi:hypothetical protein